MLFILVIVRIHGLKVFETKSYAVEYDVYKFTTYISICVTIYIFNMMYKIRIKFLPWLQLLKMFILDNLLGYCFLLTIFGTCIQLTFFRS
jgi:hypothetical protein